MSWPSVPDSPALIPSDQNFYDTEEWHRVFEETCLDPGDLPRIERLDGGHVLPLRERPDTIGPIRGRRLEWLGNYYTCRYAPLLTSPDAASSIAKWGREVRRSKPRPSLLVFAAMDRPSAGFDALWTGLRQAGYLVEATEDFGNWFLNLESVGDFQSYWADRNSRLRNTVERKERALFRAHRARVELLETPAETARAIDLYQRVHADSWKEPEPYPNFIPSLIAAGFDAGAVRIGALMVDDEPVAAQLWIVWNRRATIFKLSYAEQFARFSPGSILTRHMMRDAFNRGGLDEIDFGCGDDPYKQEWLTERRQRWMLTAYDPLSPGGAVHTLRRYVPRLVRRRLLGR
jgi:CelD/BcsL family acetyltransferase involved in cellulose biosynthesis